MTFTSSQSRRRTHRMGVSLIETLIALAITAILLTATMVAVDASFRAYATATEQASTHSSTRLVIHRLLTLVRTSIAHGPLDDVDEFGVPNPGVVRNGKVLTSPYLEMQIPDGDIIRLEYDADNHVLNMILDPDGPSPETQPILGGVVAAQFTCVRRASYDAAEREWVLDRASMDLQVEADDDATLALEDHRLPPIRAIASTMPRRLE